MIYNQKSLQSLALQLEDLPKTENGNVETLKELIKLVSWFSNERIRQLAPRIDEVVKGGSEEKIRGLIKDLKHLQTVAGLLNVPH